MSNYNFPVAIRMRRGCDIQCSWCGTLISRGEVYATWGQVHDGYISQMTMHSDCYNGGWKLFGSYDNEFLPGEMVMGQPEFSE